MEVITIYKSIDGKTFDDEFDCLEHEMNILENNSDIQIYGKYNKKLHNWYEDETYNQVVKIVIPSESAIHDLKQIQDYCGFYYDIPANVESIGTWKFNEKTEKFEKVK